MSSGQKYTPDLMRNFNCHPQNKARPRVAQVPLAAVVHRRLLELLERADPPGEESIGQMTASIAVSGSGDGLVRPTRHLVPTGPFRFMSPTD